MSTLIIQVDLNNYNRQIAVTYEIKTSIVCCGWKMNKNIISTRLTFSKHLLYEFKFHYKSVISLRLSVKTRTKRQIGR